MMGRASIAAIAILAAVAPAHAQDAQPGERVRVALGPQIVPSYPGADRVSVRPFIDVDRARGDAPFVFEAPDESFGIDLLTFGRLSFGPALGFEGRRRPRDVGGAVPEVGFTVEVGGFAQYALTDAVRLRAEMRQGIGGHKGLVANIGADYVMRQRDDWLVFGRAARDARQRSLQSSLFRRCAAGCRAVGA